MSNVERINKQCVLLGAYIEATDRQYAAVSALVNAKGRTAFRSAMTQAQGARRSGTRTNGPEGAHPKLWMLSERESLLRKLASETIGGERDYC
jgi:hypothetical protein